MINNGMFTSETDVWSTPQDFYNKINLEFDFELDVCALPSNAKCANYFTPEQDGLAQEWTGTCWCNPPYGREIGKWIKKASEAKATVVCLVPARTDTAWWHDYAMKAWKIHFIKGRIKFLTSKKGQKLAAAPAPSCLVVFKPGQDISFNLIHYSASINRFSSP